MPISLIYARTTNYCIGANGALPWSLPDEYAHFTHTTTGSAVVMGRKTYQDHNSCLHGRMNIVITGKTDFPLAAEVLRACSLDEAIALAAQESEEVYVIGGGGLLAEALPMATTVYETIVHTEIAGDTFVDAFDFAQWRTELMQEHGPDERHAYGFSIYRHTRDSATAAG